MPLDQRRKPDYLKENPKAQGEHSHIVKVGNKFPTLEVQDKPPNHHNI